MKTEPSSPPDPCLLDAGWTAEVHDFHQAGLEGKTYHLYRDPVSHRLLDEKVAREVQEARDMAALVPQSRDDLAREAVMSLLRGGAWGEPGARTKEQKLARAQCLVSDARAIADALLAPLEKA